MTIRKQLLDRIRRDTDLVALIREVVPLAGARRLYRGPCPFREVEAETLEVHADEAFFYCSDCGRDGDAFEWLVMIENVSLEEAADMLLTQLRTDRVA